MKFVKLFIDTHNWQEFGVGLQANNGEYAYQIGQDACKEMMVLFDKLLEKSQKHEISEIVIIKGPGSLTGLRIGSSTTLGIALGIEMSAKKPVKITALSLYDILLAEYPNSTIVFYTGTKKWIIKTRESEIISEDIINTKTPKSWISNCVEKLSHFDICNNIAYPKMIQLMQKYQHLATEDIQLLYPVTMYSV